MSTPLLGWIGPSERTPQMQAECDAARAGMVRYALPMPTLAKGDVVNLTRAWSHPDVVADVGFPFQRIYQHTGSCVHSGGTLALMTSIAIQRVATDAPTKAFLPFTYHNYAISRAECGFLRAGDGSAGTTFWRSLYRDGVTAWKRPESGGRPDYKNDDGIEIKAAEEYAWSTTRNPGVAVAKAESAGHTIAQSGECRTVADIRAMNLNGFGVSFACDRYIGHGRVVGSGDRARVMGKWDSSGGHQQSIHGVEEHPDLGPIYLVCNNWARNTYPILESQPVCSTWVLEADVEAALRYNAEVYGVSHLAWFPAQPKVPEALSWLI